MNERQRGFTLLETVIGAGLATMLVLGLTTALCATIHANASAYDRATLADHATNILTDLRGSTGYDGTALAALEGRSVVSRFPESSAPNAPTLTATIAVSNPGGTTAPVVATVTVANAAGLSVTQTQTLYQEAPAPGSVIDEASPSPSPGAAGSF